MKPTADNFDPYPSVGLSLLLPPVKYMQKSRWVFQGLCFTFGMIIYWNQAAEEEVEAFHDAGSKRKYRTADYIYLAFVVLVLLSLVFSLSTAVIIARRDISSFRYSIYLNSLMQFCSILIAAYKFRDASVVVTVLALTNITVPDHSVQLVYVELSKPLQDTDPVRPEVISTPKPNPSVQARRDELSFEENQKDKRLRSANLDNLSDRNRIGNQIFSSIMTDQGQPPKKKRPVGVRFTMPHESNPNKPDPRRKNGTVPIAAIGDLDDSPKQGYWARNEISAEQVSLMISPRVFPSDSSPDIELQNRTPKQVPKPILKLPMDSEHSGMDHEEEKYVEPPDGTPNLLSFRNPFAGATRGGDRTHKKDSGSRSPITPIKVPSRESSPLEAHNSLRRGDLTPSFEPHWPKLEPRETVHPVIREASDESGVPEFLDENSHQVSKNGESAGFAQIPDPEEPPQAEASEEEGEDDESEELEPLESFAVKEAPITMTVTKLAVAIIVASFWNVPFAIKFSSLLMCSDSVVFIIRCGLVLLDRVKNKQPFVAVQEGNSKALKELSFKQTLNLSRSSSMVPKVGSKDISPESLPREPQSLENIHRTGDQKSKLNKKSTKSFTAFHDKVVSSSRFSPQNEFDGIQNTDQSNGPKLKKQLMRDLSLEALQASPGNKPRPILMNNQQRFHRIRSYSSDKIGTEKTIDRRATEQMFNSHKWKTQHIEDVHSDQEGHRVSVNDFSPRLLLKDHKIRQMAPHSGIYPKETHLQNEATKIHVLAAYFSMIDQLLLVADSKMNILANNYSKPIFTRVVRRVQDRFDIDILTDTDDCHRLTDVFAFVADEELRCGRDTLENLSRVFRLFDFSATKVSKKEHYASKGITRILEVLEKLCRGVKVQPSPHEQVGQFKKFKDFNQITNSLRAINVKNGSVTTCRFSISEFILLIQEYLETLSSSRIRNFISDLNFTFIFMENVQLKIRLQPLEEIYYVFVVFENITDKVALGDANSRLNFSVSLINSLSHEMFTPLHHMQWVVEGLHQKIVGQNMAVVCSRNQPDNFKTELISDILVIKQFGMGLSMFVQNILDFANIVNNTFDLYYKKFRVKDLFEEILSIFSHKAKQKHITLEYEVSDTLEMVSDYNRLAGLIFNFTDNSMKFTQKGGITLKAHLQEDTVVFRVVDTGVGIDEGDLKKICQFLNDPFLSEKTNDSAGIGIGLRMSQAILRQLTFGDTALFEIDSEKSQGTTIQFEIKQMKSTPNDRSTSSPQTHNLQVANQQPFWQIQSPRFNMQMNALNLKEVQSDKVKTFIEERLKIHTMCKNQIDEEEDEDEHDEPEPPEQPLSAGLNRRTSNQVEQVRQKLQLIHSIEEKFNSDDLNELDSASKLAGKSPSKAKNPLAGIQDKFSDGAKPASKTNKFVDEFTNQGEKLPEMYKMSAELLSEKGSGMDLQNKPKSNRSPDLRQANSMEIGGGGEALDINSVLITPVDGNGSKGPKQASRAKTTVRRRTTLDGILEHKAPSMWNAGDLEIAQQIQTKKNAKRLISLSITHTPEPNARHSVKLSDHQSQERPSPLERLSQGVPSPSAQPGHLNSLPEPLGHISRTLSGSGRRLPPTKPEKPQKKVALVVDDEIMNTEIAKEIVARFGLEVFTASNGDLALEICYKFLSKKKRIDIIFMDYSMPGLRGDQVTAILRETRFLPILEQTPIIGLTAHNDSETKKKCLASGMDKVELKPFNVAKIRELLSEHGLVDPLANEDESQEGRRAADLDLASK